jgi:uncharacterized tellurite resistance protein B-like protein
MTLPEANYMTSRCLFSAKRWVSPTAVSHDSPRDDHVDRRDLKYITSSDLGESPNRVSGWLAWRHILPGCVVNLATYRKICKIDTQIGPHTRTEMTKDQTITRFEGTQLVVETGSRQEVYDAQFLVAALLVSIANSDGEISAIETEKMLQLVGDHFELKSAESLELLTKAMEDLAENPDLTTILKELATILTSVDKEDVAVMMYKVVAADGREGEEEMDTLAAAAELIGISPEALKKARARFFAER